MSKHMQQRKETDVTYPEGFEPKNAAYWKRQCKAKGEEIAQLRKIIEEEAKDSALVILERDTLLAEIEGLNAQVARCKSFIEDTMILYSQETELGKGLTREANKLLGEYPSDWLATHDKQVRDVVIEEIAVATWKLRLSQCERHAIRDEIRKMKGERNG